MKRVLFILIAFLIGFGGYFAASHFKGESKKLNLHHVVKKGLGFEKWVAFAPKGESFTASFPKKPESTERDLPIPGGEQTLPYKEFIYKAEGEKYFSVSYTTLPDGWLKYGDSLVLGGALKVIRNELGKTELVGTESSKFKSFPALDYEHYTDTTETAGTLILVENVLYKVEMTYPLEMHDAVQDEIANFINNFTPSIPTPSENLEADIPQSQ